MKTQVKRNLDLAAELYQVILQRKELEKQEAELKAQIKEIMKDESILEAGNIFITVQERSRTDLDKKALEQHLGSEMYKSFEKKSTYSMMNVLQK